MNDLFSQYPMPDALKNIPASIEAIRNSSTKFYNDADALQEMFNSIDLTTLSTTDSAESVKAFVNKVNTFASETETKFITGALELNEKSFAEYQAQIQALNLAASQAAQNQYLVNELRPCPKAAYIVPNPFGCNCNNGCGC